MKLKRILTLRVNLSSSRFEHLDPSLTASPISVRMDELTIDPGLIALSILRQIEA
jgi:hypothetical protein